jgi:hypothetical protein
VSGGHRSLDRFGFSHVALAKEIKDVPLLGEDETIRSRDSFHAEEEVEGPEVLDGKVNSQGVEERGRALRKRAGDEDVVNIYEDIGGTEGVRRINK